MTYLLDTDTLVFYLLSSIYKVVTTFGKSSSASLWANFVQVACASESCTTGRQNHNGRAERRAEVDRLRRLLTALPLGNAETERFGALKASLESRGERLADADLMIAATALAHNLVVVTGNLRHYGRVGGLQIENWTQR